MTHQPSGSTERGPEGGATIDEPDEVRHRLEDAARRIDDVVALRVLADWLMERSDPRGRLISLQLDDEEQGTELMRKVKVNVLIRDHSLRWSPPGARVTAFRRGFASEIEWFDTTDPTHLAWKTAQVIHCRQMARPDPEVLRQAIATLHTVSGLYIEPFLRLAEFHPTKLEALELLVPRRGAMVEARRPLKELGTVRRLTLRALQDLSPLSLDDVNEVMREIGSLEWLRVPMPTPIPSVAQFEALSRRTPRVKKLELTLWADAAREHVVVDPIARTLATRSFAAATRDWARDLSHTMGARLTLVGRTS